MTTILTQSLLPYSSTATLNTGSFRNFVQVYTGIFSSSGWVNTEASGSINYETVSPPAFVDSFNPVGYQVWRFNDVLQSTYPVYVKIEYGGGFPFITGTTFQLSTTIFISVGFQHDGTASISPTGVNGVGSTPRMPCQTIYGDSGVLYYHRACCISGSDFVSIMAQDGQTPGAFSVERTKDSNGNITTEGIVVRALSTAATDTLPQYRESYLLYSQDLNSTIVPQETTPTYLIRSNATSPVNNTITVGMLIPMLSSSFGYPSRMIGYINSPMLSNDFIHTITLFNTASKYYIPSQTNFSDYRLRGRSQFETHNLRLIIRYE